MTATNAGNGLHRRRWNRLIISVATTSAIITLVACDNSGKSVITDESESKASESDAPAPAYAFESFGDVCPSVEVIPDRISAPVEIGYATESKHGEESFYFSNKCTYDLAGEMKSLDGTDSLYRMVFDFSVTDGSPLELIAPGAFSAVDFAETGDADYFREWDQAMVSYEHDPTPTGYELEASDYVLFQFFASKENLYVYAEMSFVVVDADRDMEPDIDTEAVAYQIIEAIAAPVVAELDRQ